MDTITRGFQELIGIERQQLKQSKKNWFEKRKQWS